jgi:uncharacterized protein YdhG (YjbR/CyaY superfamily)
MTKFKNVDEYIIVFPKETQKILEQIRETVKKAAPDAEEIISYGMPSYKQKGRLLYFAAFKNHIGFYPMTTGIEAYKDRLFDYKWAKGSIQFPIDKPMPLELIAKIVKFRVNENLEKSNNTKKKRDHK